MYAELHCLSNFSFLRGASHPEELVHRAEELGYHALAITDECSVAGVVRAHVEAKQANLPLIIGSELHCQQQLSVVALAQSRRGYAALSQLITRARRAAPKGSYYLEATALAGALDECCLIWLPQDNPDLEQGRYLQQHFAERVWLGIELHCHGRDRQRLQQLLDIAAALQMPATACGGALMHVRERKELHDTLTAIRLNTPVAECGYALQTNGERHLRSLAALTKLYPPELLAETGVIAKRCNFSLDELRYEYPRELVPQDETPISHLTKLTYQGAHKHWPDGIPEKVQKLLRNELQLISELKYESFFLTVHDLVREANQKKILCQGRGSAANSAVCFCLGVTAVDPARQEVLFERFISKERGEPPDIDVDFEHERREEIIQYIYTKYGRHRTGLAATVIAYRWRSAMRDVGKALGLDVLQLERLILALRRRPEAGEPQMARWLHEAGFDPDSAVIKQLMALVDELQGFPRHLSQHVGGFVIAEDNLDALVPIENASMPERTVIQWDKDDLESLGLLKVDVLALGMLTVIRRALAFYNQRHGTCLTLKSIPAEDPKVYAMIQRADTIGVFQIESRAQMSMLPRLKPKNFYDLVVEIAIVRPGPIQGDMVHPYLRRRDGLETIEYPSDAVKAVLERTLGVPIFQEQVMQIAVVAAGFTPGEADQLRRAMATWKKSGKLEQFRARLHAGMLARDYTLEYAERIFKQIEGFGEYGFPESHSSSFAILAYSSAWLKCYAPVEFTAALLNSQPMGFYQPAQLVRDARDHGVVVRPVDVLFSEWLSTLEFDDSFVGAVREPSCLNSTLQEGGSRTAPTQNVFSTEAINHQVNQPALRLGLHQIAGFSEQAAQRLVATRQERPFSDAQDLALRARLSTRDLEALAAADALRSLAGNRHQAAWKLAGVDTQLPLFAELPLAEATPLLPVPSEAQNILADYRSTSMTLRRHPLALLRDRCLRRHILSAVQLQAIAHDTSIRIAGLVLNRQSPQTAKDTTFMTLEDETGHVNLIVWSSVAQRYRQAFLAAQLLEVTGRLQHQSGVMHVVVESMIDRSNWIGTLQIKARDFH